MTTIQVSIMHLKQVWLPKTAFLFCKSMKVIKEEGKKLKTGKRISQNKEVINLDKESVILETSI